MAADKVLIEDNADGNKYIGEAPAGTATSANQWLITRIGGTPKAIETSAPNVQWDNRTSETYT